MSFRSHLPAKYRQPLGRARDLGIVTLARAAASGLRMLPDSVLLAVRQRTQQLRTMDYVETPIHLYVDSDQDRLVRLHAVQKEPETVAWIRNTIRPGDVLYDIGANIGSYSLIAATFAQYKISVYAFEPSYANYMQLNRNIQANAFEGVITPLPVALWKDNGLRSFRYSTLDTGSAFHGVQTDNGDHRVSAAYVQPVLTYRLDDFVAQFGLKAPTHLKVDVDGEELEILRASVGCLTQPSLRTILVEVIEENIGPIVELLESFGFVVTSKHWHEGTRAWNAILSRS